MIPDEKVTLTRSDFVRIVGGIMAFFIIKKVAGGTQASKAIKSLSSNGNAAYGGSSYGGKKA